MRNRNDPTKPTILTSTEARQGETSGHVRTVLGVSLAFAVIAGIALAFYYS